MRRRILFYAILFILGLTVQFGLSQYLTLWGLAPNIILICVIFAALNDGPAAGQWMGFLWGIAWDTMSVSMFGSRAFSFTLIGYLTGMLSRKLDESKISSQATVVLAASVLYTLMIWAIYQVFSAERGALGLNYITLLQPFYNVLLAPIIFAVGRSLTAGLFRNEE